MATVNEMYPTVSPMMVRSITFGGPVSIWSNGTILCGRFKSEVVGKAEKRCEWDEDVVDCSGDVLQCTSALMFHPEVEAAFLFPSKRWRSHRDSKGPKAPREGEPFLYIGNPVRIFRLEDGTISVLRCEDLLIRSGVQLGF